MTEDEIKELLDMNAQLNLRVKQLESLLRRIHKATDQFYEKEKSQRKKPDTCPYDDILKLYHYHLDRLPKVNKLTDKRKRAMRARWEDDMSDLEDWRNYFIDASKKPFLFGRNERGWIANFDFFLREQTIANMQEGKYG